MTFPRIRLTGTWTGTIFSAELEDFDDHLSKAIDGDQGGAYAPAGAIVIGGAGLEVSGLLFSSGAANFSGGVTISDGGLSVSHDVVIGDDLTVVDQLTVFGDTLLDGAAEVTGDLTVDGVANLAEANITLLAGYAIEAVNLTVTGAFALSAPGTLSKKLSLSPGGGGIAESVYTLPNTNTAVDITLGTVFSAHFTSPAANTYTLNDTGAGLGSKCEFVNATSQIQTVKNAGGTTLGTVAAVSGMQLGKLRLLYTNDGSVVRWLAD